MLNTPSSFKNPAIKCITNALVPFLFSLFANLSAVKYLVNYFNGSGSLSRKYSPLISATLNMISYKTANVLLLTDFILFNINNKPL